MPTQRLSMRRIKEVLRLKHVLQKRLQFDFDRPGEQITGSIAQDFCQCPTEK
ncbi:hypothetical protein [Bradyrhizobium sp. CCGUVB23]|uniref:hypothetical protein n=1 Tax=Bradyrhizobium sp. CCGUVB23 TaxID=2949630 RepID=UPI0020B2EF77|nr:hypothetical protein [Bradyrhizobium sp. CCGUVB23]MCP3468449.1 hypothetical protein [Bradyrhizobium sp. CCGUVB23]